MWVVLVVVSIVVVAWLCLFPALCTVEVTSDPLECSPRHVFDFYFDPQSSLSFHPFLDRVEELYRHVSSSLVVLGTRITERVPIHYLVPFAKVTHISTCHYTFWGYNQLEINIEPGLGLHIADQIFIRNVKNKTIVTHIADLSGPALLVWFSRAKFTEAQRTAMRHIPKWKPTSKPCNPF
eukprot:TRINITY_DN3471_c0_g1_i2.p1 TRINITY_DN3471_c0_g1~~TRINITY_DN3471_c0_g1_i2.p1  ORF type:complete len:180 (+),score=1.58 TRINITY_DN3471_c0_g1_i2:55-594(+)